MLHQHKRNNMINKSLLRSLNLFTFLKKKFAQNTERIWRSGIEIGLELRWFDCVSPVSQSGFSYWSFATVFIPSSKCGTTLSFRYTRAGAPPGRTCVFVALDRSTGTFEPSIFFLGWRLVIGEGKVDWGSRGWWFARETSLYLACDCWIVLVDRRKSSFRKESKEE